MALASGTKFGPYQIEAPLGAGGMGEVYRSRDTRLDRTVAVKILPAHLSDNQDAKQRFEREARTISSLNHPNICVLHDVGNENGTAYLVMEYVQGESLDARLKKGPLPLKQALECGMQICDALEKAHRAGITHRDLKPGNIMLTASGAKLLDFGLAKRAAALLGAQVLTGDHTLSPSTPTMNLTALTAPASALTQQGAIVGTFQFMAPEVLQGKEADARSDIFSFGCVLYEMITGKRAFEGKSQLSVASAILEKEPERISVIQPMAPPALDHVVSECLAKDPEARWQSAADIGRELRWIASSGSGSSATAMAPVRPRRRWRETLVWGAVVLALVAALAWTNLREREPERTLRTYLAAPTDMVFNFTGDFSGPPAITPDGTMVAFCAHTKTDPDSIWVQALTDLAPKRLEGTEGAAFPFWSPDGKYLGFFAGGKLKKVAASGAPVTVLADAVGGRGGAWNQDNVIIYEPDYRDSLWRINASGGTPVGLTKFESSDQTTHRWPKFMPDGKHFVFFAANHTGDSSRGVFFGSLADGSYKRVADSDSDAQYASGYLLYYLQSQLMAQKFDPSSGVTSGDPIQVASNVEYDTATWHTTFSVSQNGLLVYEPGSKMLGTILSMVDHSGKLVGQPGQQAFYKGSGRISPDGKRLAAAIGEPQSDIYLFDLKSGARTRLTFGGGAYTLPSWSADGQRIVYAKQIGGINQGQSALCSRLANGGGQEEVLLQRDLSGTSHLLSPQLSPDGKYLVHLERGPGGAGVWAMSLTGDKKLFPIVQSQSLQTQIVEFSLSPDGRWLAYTSTETGRQEAYVTHFPSGAGKWQISQEGGTFPGWSRDGKDVYFIGLAGFLSAVSASTKNDELEVGQTRRLFQLPYLNPGGNVYDPAPDNQQFAITTLPENIHAPLVLVTNWASDLKK